MDAPLPFRSLTWLDFLLLFAFAQGREVRPRATLAGADSFLKSHIKINRDEQFPIASIHGITGGPGVVTDLRTLAVIGYEPGSNWNFGAERGTSLNNVFLGSALKRQGIWITVGITTGVGKSEGNFFGGSSNMKGTIHVGSESRVPTWKFFKAGGAPMSSTAWARVGIVRTYEAGGGSAAFGLPRRSVGRGTPRWGPRKN